MVENSILARFVVEVFRFVLAVPLSTTAENEKLRLESHPV